ncbi:hypothetical protein HBI56_038480 [Parastagonospora nodorum]|uniref:Uncharacterized protein n=1 Tax=Phaeosphaeria nodorum (strain SN15 / ATCC MYA-4574 / FGSC 10173) TaxID=321614 RepID=Q0UX00_PHANO|nr:hypothetical protein SNOG_03714 [Parastagonospora nodorum SN15]KAH3916060.1 hypothetical protein HBH56_068320 [Parastagonospora nodorum]EAT88919.1 hypothetical protein SNOG_03714 [Parastagonospora nodorum SN15]KAH3932595.1 hypothetical protein HBH54_079800 [Parastagonospora nodorum]KAH4143411.1 hypothetical protein HBH45_034830 [Parastagonospora nodorum]KAH4165687.1 hypothetical protein HBH44_068550 [Parastagonospora nodorum]
MFRKMGGLLERFDRCGGVQRDGLALLSSILMPGTNRKTGPNAQLPNGFAGVGGVRPSDDDPRKRMKAHDTELVSVYDTDFISVHDISLV